MCPLVHELRERNAEHLIIHSGQHYSEVMDRSIMEDAGLSEPQYSIKREEDWITHAQQTAYMLTAIEEVLMKEKPSILLVCGDANTNLAGALAARKIHVKVGHVESGLRSFDWRMPEEHNRVIIDHISEYLFAPTHQARQYLLDDGVRGKIFVVGNTIVDATLRHAEKAKQERQPRVDELTGGAPFVLLTLHREENVDDPAILANIIEAIAEIGKQNEYMIVFPCHPRTMNRLREFDLLKRTSELKNLNMINPLGYLDFLAFLANAHAVMTDSGGIQEESCILKVPCITLRESTERQETVNIGANRVGGTRKEGIVKAFNQMKEAMEKVTQWENPFGDGKASKRIIDTCLLGGPEDEPFQEQKD